MPVAPPVPPDRVPRPLTTLVDRKRELAALAVLLRDGAVPLVTLTGPGGVGKTRVAIAAAAAAVADFPDGVAFVSLSPISDPDLVAPTIAHAFGLRDMGAVRLEDRLRDLLADRQMLLVLDNFEQVTGAAPLLTDLLAASPDLKLLVTSRMRLRLSGEWEYPVRPLPVIDPAREALGGGRQVEAVQLFAERARAVAPDFVMTPENTGVVAEICHRLDGLPLAIELAAARVKVLSPAALLARMEPRLPLLTGGGRDLPLRQQTMHDTIAWSYDHMTPADQTLFRRLTVFVGGFDLEGTEAVGGAAEQDEPDRGADAGEELFYQRSAPPAHLPTVLDGLTSLVEQSMVQRVANPEVDDPRYRMLEIVREFGRERLAESGEEATVRMAHAAFVTDLVESLAAQVWLPDPDPALARLDAEHDNVRAALGWAEAAGEVALGLQLVCAMAIYWRGRGYLREGRGWLERALGWGESSASVERARVLHGLGWLAIYQGDLDRAEEVLDEGVGIAVAVGARMTEARARNALALAYLHQGRLAEAAAMMDQALTLSQELEPTDSAAPLFVSITYARRGLIARVSGELAAAAGYLVAAERRLRATGHTWALSETLRYLGDVTRDRGDLVRALVYYQESLALAEAHGDRLLVADALDGVASVVATRRQPEQAARLDGATAALREQLGTVVALWDQSAYDRRMAAVQATLSPEAFAASWAAGRTLPLEQAIAEALSDLGPERGHLPPATSAPHLPAAIVLTAREAEVLRLLAEGLSDREIAEDLSISSRTVSGHVTHLLGKLGVDSRTAAVAYALRHRLVDSSSSPPSERPA